MPGVSGRGSDGGTRGAAGGAGEGEGGGRRGGARGRGRGGRGGRGRAAGCSPGRVPLPEGGGGGGKGALWGGWGPSRRCEPRGRGARMGPGAAPHPRRGRGARGRHAGGRAGPGAPRAVRPPAQGQRAGGQPVQAGGGDRQDSEGFECRAAGDQRRSRGTGALLCYRRGQALPGGQEVPRGQGGIQVAGRDPRGVCGGRGSGAQEGCRCHERARSAR
mmetsp:Transcript_3955/g.12427  ORF Transcript_3955/g.12427 Transcript_3955/m.12427 type:complete len:217 (+) Transcript_3955:478-1128(+)